MDDTTITGENVEIVQSSESAAALSWSAAIAGAIAATATTFIVVSLGVGIELALASPFSTSPSASSMTIAGAIWLVLAQSIGFAVGGFIAGRLRVNDGSTSPAETRFRDGVSGFVAWSIGAVAAAAIVAMSGAMAISTVARASSSAVGQVTQNISNDQLGYFADSLVRTAPSRPNAENADADRAQVTRILANSIRSGQLSGDDKTYLAGLVAARTGVSQDEAQKRVDDVVARARTAVTEASDAARKAGQYVAFWTFMSMLFGAVAAAFGGMLGGELRDESQVEQTPVLRGA
jgi:hypothetical protein